MNCCLHRPETNSTPRASQWGIAFRKPTTKRSTTTILRECGRLTTMRVHYNNISRSVRRLTRTIVSCTITIAKERLRNNRYSLPLPREVCSVALSTCS
jgi:hypothetical protein